MDAALWSRLKAGIDNDFCRMILDTAGCGPFDGGCLVVARALQKVVGGEIVVLTRAGGRAEHAAVFRNGVLIDYDGPLEPMSFIRRFNVSEFASTVGFRNIEAADLPGAYRSADLEDQLALLIRSALAQLAGER